MDLLTPNREWLSLEHMLYKHIEVYGEHPSLPQTIV